MEFGQYLRQLRKAKGMTMYALAKQTGCSHPYISQIETGQRRNVSPEIIREISVALGVTHIGLMIKAGHVTEQEVFTYREQNGVYKH